MTATTYYLPLLNQQQGESVALLEVLDWALVDGVLMAIDHSVIPSGNTTTSGGTVYTLILQFPAFDNSIEYDPSLNLGIFVGPQSGSGGGSADLGLIVGAAVGVSAAVIVIGFVITTATVGGIILAKRRQNTLWSINFDGAKSDEAVPSQS